MKRLEALRLNASSILSMTRHVSMLAWVLALGITAWVAADLFWRIVMPRSGHIAVVSESGTERAAQSIAARHFMGEASVTVPKGGTGRFSLFGVVTGNENRPGFAVLAVDGGAARGAVAGDEVVPGVVLAGIFADHIELRSATGIERVLLRLAPAAAVGQPSASDS